jgi:ATP-dependent protease ClpP protease subunit
MITVMAKAGKSAEILIHEAIGGDWLGDGMTSKKFAKELRDLGDVSDIKVRINSPGGAVSDGVAIYNALKAHGAKVTILVEGLAASIASIIAMAGDEIIMGEGALMMIHSPYTFAVGNADDMRQTAAVLDKFESELIGIYQTRSGMKREDIAAMLKNETWLNGPEAVALGLANVAIGAEDESVAAARRTDYMATYQKFAKEFRQPADTTPLRIAAALKSALADAKIEDEVIMTVKEVSATEAEIKGAATAAAQAAMAAETQRRSDIRTAFGKFSTDHRELLDSCMDDPECSADKARGLLLQAVAAKQAGPSGPQSVVLVADSSDKFLAGAENSIMARMGRGQIEAGNQYAGRSLCDLAEISLRNAGISVVGLTKDGIARRVMASMTTSDFPQLLSVTAGKVLRQAYEVYPQTWRDWATTGSVSDFKVHPRIQMGSFNSLATIPEGSEYTYGSLTETYENASAVTKGKGLVFSRQMLVNDDLGGFNRRAMLMGAAAARSVNNDTYAYLTSGASNHGPTSTDTGQFFNSTAVTTAGGHANLTGTGTAISVVSLGVGRVAMQRQKDASLRDTLNIQPATLLVPVGKEDLARQIITSEADPANANSRVANIYRNRFKVVADPYLDDVSATAWYLFADPVGAAAGFEVVFLDGVQTPFVDETIDFDTDAMKFKVRLDYGIAIGDWRGGYKNVGA